MCTEAQTEKQRRIEQFRLGIFSLRTNFGEFAELMLREYLLLFPSGCTAFDLRHEDGRRIEVKFSRAYKKSLSVTAENVIEICTNCSSMVYDSDEAEDNDANYDCNIQQLKPDCFDILLYGVFFADKIELFMTDRSVFPGSVDEYDLNPENVREKLPGYARQHRGGEEFQFHLTRRTIGFHREHYKLGELTYEEVYDLFSKK